ncbi:hypothetical protein BVC80_1835g417 [Macleaya cordata]|uniref:Uncharacterized protein n=1 Tax=Macleaya cordata TaxID=56857 RepID=A0A200R5M8_MACCD|nr:hypothetical protein BVC80_1835g417 [Macleaya cordata]
MGKRKLSEAMHNNISYPLHITKVNLAERTDLGTDIHYNTSDPPRDIERVLIEDVNHSKRISFQDNLHEAKTLCQLNAEQERISFSN